MVNMTPIIYNNGFYKNSGWLGTNFKSSGVFIKIYKIIILIALLTCLLESGGLQSYQMS